MGVSLPFLSHLQVRPAEMPLSEPAPISPVCLPSELVSPTSTTGALNVRHLTAMLICRKVTCNCPWSCVIQFVPRPGAEEGCVGALRILVRGRCFILWHETPLQVHE